MSDSFPQFPQPTAIDGQRSWTAIFESFDQRNDDLYYVVDIHEGGKRTARFYVQVSPTLHPDEWDGPKFVEQVRQQLAKVAATGKTNTSYLGALVKPPGL